MTNVTLQTSETKTDNDEGEGEALSRVEMARPHLGHPDACGISLVHDRDGLPESGKARGNILRKICEDGNLSLIFLFQKKSSAKYSPLGKARLGQHPWVAILARNETRRHGARNKTWETLCLGTIIGPRVSMSIKYLVRKYLIDTLLGDGDTLS